MMPPAQEKSAQKQHFPDLRILPLLQTIKIEPRSQTTSVPLNGISTGSHIFFEQTSHLLPQDIVYPKRNTTRFRNIKFYLGQWIKGIGVILVQSESIRDRGLGYIDGHPSRVVAAVARIRHGTVGYQGLIAVFVIRLNSKIIPPAGKIHSNNLAISLTCR